MGVAMRYGSGEYTRSGGASGGGSGGGGSVGSLIDLTTAAIGARYNCTASVSASGAKADISIKFTTATGHEGAAITIPCEPNSIYAIRYKNSPTGGSYSSSYRYGLHLTNTPVTSAGSSTFDMTTDQDWGRQTSGTQGYLYAFWVTNSNTAFSFCVVAGALTSSQTLNIELEILKVDMGFTI